MTDTTTPEVPPPAGSSARTSEKTRARLSDLRPHPRNPRTISPARLEQLQRTLAAEPELLEARPLIALPDGTVVAGNQRLAAAVALGWESIPVVYADLSPEEVTRWMLLDNRGFGEDDRDAVAALLGELEAADSDLDLTGYEAADLDAMLRELHRPAADPDEADVSALVGTERPVLCVTDPPYGVAYDPAWRQEAAEQGHLAYAASRVGEVRNDDRVDWSAAWALVPGDVFYCWHAGRHASVVQSGIETAGFEIRCQIIWVKPHLPISRGHYHWRHEPCWYAVRANRPAGWIGDRKQSTIWEITLDANVLGGHSTQKPVETAERAIRNHTGDVYDPFAGTGTTLIAAERERRRCFAMEIDPAYCDVIRKRYADYVGDQSYAP